MIQILASYVRNWSGQVAGTFSASRTRMKPSSRGVGRRRFLKAVPAAVAATVTVPAAVRAQRGGAVPPKFGTDVLKCAEQIDGLQFTDAEEATDVGAASRNLDSYDELRKLTIPPDTEPAVTFRPYRGQTRTPGPTTALA